MPLLLFFFTSTPPSGAENGTLFAPESDPVGGSSGPDSAPPSIGPDMKNALSIGHDRSPPAAAARNRLKRQRAKRRRTLKPVHNASSSLHLAELSEFAVSRCTVVVLADARWWWRLLLSELQLDDVRPTRTKYVVFGSVFLHAGSNKN
nr:hypothetical protein Itr_chr14CG12190 [Ipomoea trifida]